MIYAKGVEGGDWMGPTNSAVWSAVPRSLGLADLASLLKKPESLFMFYYGIYWKTYIILCQIV